MLNYLLRVAEDVLKLQLSSEIYFLIFNNNNKLIVVELFSPSKDMDKDHITAA
jgi:hypothetical protein